MDITNIAHDMVMRMKDETAVACIEGGEIPHDEHTLKLAAAKAAAQHGMNGEEHEQLLRILQSQVVHRIDVGVPVD